MAEKAHDNKRENVLLREVDPLFFYDKDNKEDRRG
jgi:hypothetical protein